MRVEFQPLHGEHLPLLIRWLKEPYVAEFWQETENEEEFRQKFLGKLPERGVSPFVIVLDGQAIGYIQSYDAQKVGCGWWPDAQAGTFGIGLRNKVMLSPFNWFTIKPSTAPARVSS